MEQRSIALRHSRAAATQNERKKGKLGLKEKRREKEGKREKKKKSVKDKIGR
jgi:hypothetical protein